jgi:hypothetical protein
MIERHMNQQFTLYPFTFAHARSLRNVRKPLEDWRCSDHCLAQTLPKSHFHNNSV